ncbi:hypothetical protein AKO1_002330, partial [Acrasis kona]
MTSHQDADGDLIIRGDDNHNETVEATGVMPIMSPIHKSKSLNSNDDEITTEQSNDHDGGDHNAATNTTTTTGVVGGFKKKKYGKREKFVSMAEKKSNEFSANAMRQWFKSGGGTFAQKRNHDEMMNGDHQTTTIHQDDDHDSNAPKRLKTPSPPSSNRQLLHNKENQITKSTAAATINNNNLLLKCRERIKTDKGLKLKFTVAGASQLQQPSQIEQNTSSTPPQQSPAVHHDATLKSNQEMASAYDTSAQGLLFTVGEKCNECNEWISKMRIEKMQESGSVTCHNCGNVFSPTLTIDRSSSSSDQNESVRHHVVRLATCHLYSKETVEKLVLSTPADHRDNYSLLMNHAALFWNLLYRFGCLSEAKQSIIKNNKQSSPDDSKKKNKNVQDGKKVVQK